MNPKLMRQFHALLNQTGLMAQKANIVNGATNGRVCSSKEMTDTEGARAIEFLNKHAVVKPEAQKPLDRQIKMALAQFAQLGYVIEGNLLDYERINGFCKTQTAAKKRLDKMTKAELTATISQLQIIVKKKQEHDRSTKSDAPTQ